MANKRSPTASDDAVQRLLRELSRPEAHARVSGPIEVRQTHISLLFFAGDRVYKVKKPVDLGFLDFTTERRRFFCEEEVRLNRRLAERVYLGFQRRDGVGEQRAIDELALLPRVQARAVGRPCCRALAQAGELLATHVAVQDHRAQRPGHGRSVIVDASFSRREFRRTFVDAATRPAAPVAWCT